MNMISRGERSEQRLTIWINTLFYSCIMDFLYLCITWMGVLRCAHPTQTNNKRFARIRSQNRFVLFVVISFKAI